MKQHLFKATILASAVFLAACSSVPTTTSTLDQARSDFVMANNTPQISTYAPLEFKQASDALNEANAAAAKNDSLEKIDRLAYIAKQKIATAMEVARTKAAEAKIAGAGRQRDALRLEARTNEADRARAEADAAKAQAADAQAQAANAQAQAANATERAANAEGRNAQLEAMLNDLHAKQTERGMIITIGDVLFGTDQANLTPDGMATVRKLATVMQQYPNRTVLVEGFTDSTGTVAHNQELSERRASSVASTLTAMGVPRERVAMRGYGPSYPVAANDTANNRQMNRRVEIVLSNEGAAISPRAAAR
jgi:outer membrane protein OmpA-like peptidoglycan-associated protein